MREIENTLKVPTVGQEKNHHDDWEKFRQILRNQGANTNMCVTSFLLTHMKEIMVSENKKNNKNAEQSVTLSNCDDTASTSSLSLQDTVIDVSLPASSPSLLLSSSSSSLLPLGNRLWTKYDLVEDISLGSASTTNIYDSINNSLEYSPIYNKDANLYDIKKKLSYSFDDDTTCSFNETFLIENDDDVYDTKMQQVDAKDISQKDIGEKEGKQLVGKKLSIFKRRNTDESLGTQISLIHHDELLPDRYEDDVDSDNGEEEDVDLVSLYDNYIEKELMIMKKRANEEERQKNNNNDNNNKRAVEEQQQKKWQHQQNKKEEKILLSPILTKSKKVVKHFFHSIETKYLALDNLDDQVKKDHHHHYSRRRQQSSLGMIRKYKNDNNKNNKKDLIELTFFKQSPLGISIEVPKHHFNDDENCVDDDDDDKGITTTSSSSTATTTNKAELHVIEIKNNSQAETFCHINHIDPKVFTNSKIVCVNGKQYDKKKDLYDALKKDKSRPISISIELLTNVDNNDNNNNNKDDGTIMTISTTTTTSRENKQLQQQQQNNEQESVSLLHLQERRDEIEYFHDRIINNDTNDERQRQQPVIKEEEEDNITTMTKQQQQQQQTLIKSHEEEKECSNCSLSSSSSSSSLEEVQLIFYEPKELGIEILRNYEDDNSNNNNNNNNNNANANGDDVLLLLPKVLNFIKDSQADMICKMNKINSKKFINSTIIGVDGKRYDDDDDGTCNVVEIDNVDGDDNNNNKSNSDNTMEKRKDLLYKSLTNQSRPKTILFKLQKNAHETSSSTF